MQRLPIAKVLGFATLGWGIVLMTVRPMPNKAVGGASDTVEVL